MRLYQFFVALIALLVFREVAGDLLMILTGLGALANFGGLALGSFFAGWLAGAISKLGPSYGQLKGLAASGVIASIALGFAKGIHFLLLAIIGVMLIWTPLSYVCLLLGARVAEIGREVPPRDEEDIPDLKRRSGSDRVCGFLRPRAHGPASPHGPEPTRNLV